MTSFVSLGRFSGVSRPGTFIGYQRVAATQKDSCFKFEVKLFFNSSNYIYKSLEKHTLPEFIFPDFILTDLNWNGPNSALKQCAENGKKFKN